MPAAPREARGKAVEDGVRRLLGFRLHVIGNPEPLLMAAARLDHQQHDHGGAGARRAIPGEMRFNCYPERYPSTKPVDE